MTRMRAFTASLAAAAALVATLAPAPATGATRLVVDGAGFGHGVGMSQYGAYGFARRGARYDAILRHYYSGTQLGTTSPRRTIRVILQANRNVVSFRGATIAGTRRTNPRVTYRVVRRGSGAVELQTAAGGGLARFPAPLRVRGRGAVQLLDGSINESADGWYRGALEVRPGID